MENLETTEDRPFQNFVERLIDFDGWARNNKIKFLKNNNPKLLEQLIKDNRI